MSDVCGRCGRTLTGRRSRKLGFGEECWRRMRAVAAQLRAEHERELIGAFAEHQVDSALELIADGGIAHIGDYVFITISSDGLDRYTTTGYECSCPAGLRGDDCYHQAAALAFQAAA